MYKIAHVTHLSIVEHLSRIDGHPIPFRYGVEHTNAIDNEGTSLTVDVTVVGVGGCRHGSECPHEVRN